MANLWGDKNAKRRAAERQPATEPRETWVYPHWATPKSQEVYGLPAADPDDPSRGHDGFPHQQKMFRPAWHSSIPGHGDPADRTWMYEPASYQSRLEEPYGFPGPGVDQTTVGSHQKSARRELPR